MLHIPLQSFLGLYIYPLGNKLAIKKSLIHSYMSKKARIVPPQFLMILGNL